MYLVYLELLSFLRPPQHFFGSGFTATESSSMLLSAEGRAGRNSETEKCQCLHAPKAKMFGVHSRGSQYMNSLKYGKTVPKRCLKPIESNNLVHPLIQVS